MLSIFLKKRKKELHTPSHSEHPASGSQDRLLYREQSRALEGTTLDWFGL